MSHAFFRNGHWYACWKGPTGQRVRMKTRCVSKEAAQALASRHEAEGYERPRRAVATVVTQGPAAAWLQQLADDVDAERARKDLDAMRAAAGTLRFDTAGLVPAADEMTDPPPEDAHTPDRQSLGSVYVVACEGSAFCKIGFSTRVAVRLHDLQIGCPFALNLVYEIRPAEPEGEMRIHKALQEKRRRGEWFELGADDHDWLRSDEAAALAIGASADNLMSVRQACAVLGEDSRKIYDLIERGELPHLRVGSTIRLRPSDVFRIEGEMRTAHAATLEELRARSRLCDRCGHRGGRCRCSAAMKGG